jgi:hypothetical protein
VKVFIGFDGREKDAYLVAAHTLRKHASIQIEVEPLVLEQLRWKRLYNRPHSIDAVGRLWDGISRAPMATEFALTRFLIPHLVGYRGWALFVDCDFLFRADVAELFALANPAFAVQVVKRAQQPLDGTKMDGQIQTHYAKKNWSSFVLWNCAHDAHAGTLERVNRWRGLWLHQFRWLQEAEDIGDLAPEWNWLEGIDRAMPVPPKAVHFTRGIPSMPGYEDSAYGDEWRAALAAATQGRPLVEATS